MCIFLSAIWLTHCAQYEQSFPALSEGRYDDTNVLDRQRGLCPDMVDAQDDLNHRWVQMPFCLFCHGALYLVML